jgi:hypothetical protein
MGTIPLRNRERILVSLRLEALWIAWSCLSTTSFAVADPLDRWTQVSPIPTGDTLTSVVQANGIYLAGGGMGTFLRSTNGIHWSVHKFAVTNALNYSAQGVVYGNGQFVAVDGRGQVLSSSDGFHWTLNGPVEQPLLGVAYGNGRFVAVGGDGHSNGRVILASTDAVRWNVVRLSDEGTLWQVFHVADRFVAGHLCHHFDVHRRPALGLSYSAARRDRLSGVAYGNGLFVIVGGAGQLLTSPDGVKWFPSTMGLEGAAPSVIFDGNRFLIAGDGTEFDLHQRRRLGTSRYGRARRIVAMTYGDGRFVALATTGLSRPPTTASIG